MKLLEFSYCTVSYKRPVVYLTFKEGAHLDVGESRELIKAAEKLTENQPYLLFSDARVFLTITPQSRKVWADKNEAPLLIANAALINNLSLRLTANFFIKFNKPHFKYKVFTDEKKAIEWLLQFDPKKKHLSQA